MEYKAYDLIPNARERQMVAREIRSQERAPSHVERGEDVSLEQSCIRIRRSLVQVLRSSDITSAQHRKAGIRVDRVGVGRYDERIASNRLFHFFRIGPR